MGYWLWYIKLYNSIFVIFLTRLQPIQTQLNAILIQRDSLVLKLWAHPQIVNPEQHLDIVNPHYSNSTRRHFTNLTWWVYRRWFVQERIRRQARSRRRLWSAPREYVTTGIDAFGICQEKKGPALMNVQVCVDFLDPSFLTTFDLEHLEEISVICLKHWRYGLKH